MGGKYDDLGRKLPVWVIVLVSVVLVLFIAIVVVVSIIQRRKKLKRDIDEKESFIRKQSM